MLVITHMILAASMAEPPPSAMMQSGSKSAISFAPSFAQASEGSGRDVEEACVGYAHLVKLIGDAFCKAALVKEAVGHDEGLLSCA